MLLGILAAIAAVVLLAVTAVGYLAVGLWFVALGVWKGGEWLVKWIIDRRQARNARIEAELDRKQEQARRTILNLADALGMEAHEARKALIRESYLASGRLPEQPQ